MQVNESLQDRSHCLNCGYSLRGLIEHRCPECGLIFSPTHPWTMRLPHSPSQFTKRIAKLPPPRDVWIGWAALALLLWGTRLPGWERTPTLLGLYLGVVCAIGYGLHGLVHFIFRKNGWVAPASDAQYASAQRMKWLLIASLVVVTLRPTLYLSFWISRPWLEDVAQRALSNHIGDEPTDQWAGLYRVSFARQCPHGVKICLPGRDHYGLNSPGLMYKPHPGNCTKFDPTRPLGGNWYVEGW